MSKEIPRTDPERIRGILHRQIDNIMDVDQTDDLSCEVNLERGYLLPDGSFLRDGDGAIWAPPLGGQSVHRTRIIVTSGWVFDD